MPTSIEKADVAAAARFLRQRIAEADTNRDGVLSVDEASDLATSLFPGRTDLFSHEPNCDSIGDDIIGTMLTPTDFEKGDRYFFGGNVRDAQARLDGLRDHVLRSNQRLVTGSGDWLIAATHDLQTSPVFQASAADWLQEVVDGLETEIGQLEHQNQQKLGEVNTLVSQISSRERELKRQADDQRMLGFFGAFMGAPAVGALGFVQAMQTDSQLRQLHAKLTQAQADQAALQRKMADYTAFKSTVVAALADLRAAPEVKVTSVAQAPAKVQQLLQTSDLVAAAVARVKNLEAQRDVLLPLRDRAAALGADLDTTLDRLAQDLADAEKAVQTAKKATLDLLVTMASSDPNAAALKKLNGLARSEVEKALSPTVNRMLRGVKDPEVKAQLKKRIIEALTKQLFA